MLFDVALAKYVALILSPVKCSLLRWPGMDFSGELRNVNILGIKKSWKFIVFNKISLVNNCFQMMDIMVQNFSNHVVHRSSCFLATFLKIQVIWKELLLRI